MVERRGARVKFAFRDIPKQLVLMGRNKANILIGRNESKVIMK